MLDALRLNSCSIFAFSRMPSQTAGDLNNPTTWCFRLASTSSAAQKGCQEQYGLQAVPFTCVPGSFGASGVSPKASDASGHHSLKATQAQHLPKQPKVPPVVKLRVRHKHLEQVQLAPHGVHCSNKPNLARPQNLPYSSRHVSLKLCDSVSISANSRTHREYRHLHLHLHYRQHKLVGLRLSISALCKQTSGSNSLSRPQDTPNLPDCRVF